MKAAMIGRGLLWLLAIPVLLSLLLLTGSLWLIGLMAVVVLLPLFSLFWNRAAGKRAAVKVSLPSSARKKTEAKGKISAAFEKLQPLGRVYCSLELVNDLTGERTLLRVPLERDKEGYAAEFAVMTAHCGRIRGLAGALTLADFFGFLPTRIGTDSEGRMTVLPETFPVEVDDSMLSAPSDGDDTRDDRKGSDMTETFQLREYQPGDNLHGIHWKLSSKLDTLIFREPAQPVSNALLLYWDQSCGTPEQLDALAEAVFSVGQSLCQAGVSFTVGKTEQGAVLSAEITNLDELIEHFPILLRRREAEQPDISELTAFGRVFYFTASVPESGYDESVQVFLCGDGRGAAGKEIVFTPENAEEILERIDAYGV